MRHRWFLLLAIAALGCDDLPGDETRSSPPPMRAVTLADWTPDGYSQPFVAPELARIAALGTTHLFVVVTAYQEDAVSAVPSPDENRTPTLSSVRTVLQSARQAGLATALKPHVDLDDGGWRGRIRPPNVTTWFSAYEDFLQPWLQLAREEGVELFVVGTELAGTLEHEGAWRELIAELDADFDGDLLYAASWDEAEDVPFWDQLEFVGVNAYFPLSSSDSPTRLDLLAAWQQWMWRLKRLRAQSDRPLVFTEVGYRSVDGAARAPFEFQNDPRYDGGEQADLYWALLEASGDKGWLEGIVLWNWLARGGGGPNDRDFTVRGKPAEEIVTKAWAR